MPRISLKDAAALLGITREGLSVQVSRSPEMRKKLLARKTGPIWTVDQARVEKYRDERKRGRPRND